MRIPLAVLLLLPGIASAAQCSARSGAGTAALVELYTAEGCSSCAPADRWLSTLSSRPAGSVVPVALHVDYWDYIGSKDPYAKREFSLRQRKFSPLQRMALVYTPQVMLQGRDFRGWGGKAFDEALTRINAQPAKANLRLAILGADAGGLQVEAAAELVQASAAADLYLAAYGSRLLAHDYVVLQWEGPFAVSATSLVERRKLPLLPGAAPAHSGVAAFVQDRRTREVLQALLRSYC
ncbi:MAG TPA: DUF1223 domain-containing protein [Burkholderiales bacterium]